MLSHGERIRATTCRNRAPFTIRSKEMMIFNLSSLVSSDIVLRVKGAGLNGSEKSESSQAWIRNQFSRSSFPSSIWRHRMSDVPLSSRSRCSLLSYSNLQAIVLSTLFLFFFSSRKFRKGRNFDEELRKHVSQFPRFKTKSWISNTPFTRQAFVLRVHQDSW